MTRPSTDAWGDPAGSEGEAPVRQEGRGGGRGRGERGRARLWRDACGSVCAGLLWVVSGPTLAASPPGPAWSIAPQGSYQYTLDPGAAAGGAFRLSNPSGRSQTLTLYGADMESAAGGGFAPAQADQPMRGVGSWLHLRQHTVTLAARSQIQVRFAVDVPVNTPPGVFDGALVASAAAARQGAGFTIRTRAALTVTVLVAAIPAEVSTAGQALAGSDGSWSLWIPPGAFAHRVRLSVTPAAGSPVPFLPPPPPGAAMVVPPLVLSARDGDGRSVTAPRVPLRLRLPLPPDAPPGGLFVVAFDPALHAWLPLPTTLRGGAVRAALRELAPVAVFSMPRLVPFRDLADHWALGPVLALQALGVVHGYPDGTFRPQAAVTRAEFAGLLAGGLHPPAAGGAAPAGLPAASALAPWAGPDLAAVAAAGWMGQGPDGNREGGGPLRRAEAAAVLARALQLPAAATPSFTDLGQVPQRDLAAVAAATAAGLLRGYPDGSFRPRAAVSRAEAAAMVLRAMRYRGAAW